MFELIKNAIEICNVQDVKKYSAILINARYTMKQQKDLALFLQKNGITSFVINSEYKNPITLYENDYTCKNLKISTIQNLFDYFEESNDYKCHLLISNKMANRAISFRPSYPKKGGLIGEIYIPSESSNCANKIQSLRLCGNYEENYPNQHLWISKNDLSCILNEYENIYNKFIPANKEYGESRKQIENINVWLTGKHDREKVDDSKCVNKFNICDNVYDTKEQCIQFVLKNGYDIYKIMTEENLLHISNIPELTEENTDSQKKQNEFRKYITEQLEKLYHIKINKNGLNVGWKFHGNDGKFYII